LTVLVLSHNTHLTVSAMASLQLNKFARRRS